MVDYISAKETAKFVRGVLKQHFKKNFPNTKFSVRMDGNSLDIRWIARRRRWLTLLWACSRAVVLMVPSI